MKFEVRLEIFNGAGNAVGAQGGGAGLDWRLEATIGAGDLVEMRCYGGR